MIGASNAGAIILTTHDTLARWHDIVRTRDASRLQDLLADDVVFFSPVVHTPQRGKAITTAYLSAALHVFGRPSFRYVRQIAGERDAMLEFELEIDGTHINGVDIIRTDDTGRIVEFKVMLRPLQGVQTIHRLMGEMLATRAAPR
jgi:hypothetical protein